MKYNFKFLDVFLNIRLKDQSVVDFLKAYFIPYFEIKKGWVKNAIANISVDVDEKYLAPDTLGNEILVDGSKGFLATTAKSIHASSAKELVLFPMNTYIYIGEQEINLKASSAERVKVPLLRIIEDIVQIEVERSGAIFIHSSGIVTQSGAVLAVGDKHAGKTSFLCNSLGNFKCQKLNNDIAVLYIEDDRVLVRGWPSFFKVELGTVAHNKHLSKYFLKNKADLLNNSLNLWDHQVDKLPFYPSQAAKIFKKKIIPGAQLHSILLPQFSLNDIKYEKAVMSLEDIQNILRQNLQGTFNKKHPNWHSYNEVCESTILASSDKIAEAMVDNVSFHSIQWGPSFTQLMTEVESLNSCYEQFIDARKKVPAKKSKWPAMPPVF